MVGTRRSTQTIRALRSIASLCVAVALLSIAPVAAQISDARFAAIRTLLDGGDYARAESDATGLRDDTLRLNVSLDDKDRATDLLVEALYRNGHGADVNTQALANTVVQSRSARVAGDDLQLAGSLRNLGDVLHESGRFKPAAEPLRAALAMRERLLGVQSPAVIGDLDHLAHTLLWAEQWDEARQVSARALQLGETVYGTEDVRLATTLDLRAELLQRTGKYADSLAAVERAVRLREAASSPRPDLARSSSLLAEVLWYRGEVIRSKEASERALALAEESLRPAHPDLAVYLRRLALPLVDLGDLARARQVRERAVAIAEAAYGRIHPSTALQLNDLGNSFFQQADYAAARPLFESAIKGFEIVAIDSDGAMASLLNLGIVNAGLGDYGEAERCYRQAMDTWTRKDQHHPRIAYALFALGDIRQTMGQYAEALGFYQQALALREASLGAAATDLGRTLTRLAQVLLETDNVQLARTQALRAVDIWQRAGGEESRGYVDALAVLADVEARMGDAAAARASYEAALSMARRVYIFIHPRVAEIQRSLAIALSAAGAAEPALQTALQAEELDRDHVKLTVRYLAERQALGYAGSLRQSLSLALSLAERAPGHEQEVYDRLVKARALTLDEMAARHHFAADDSVASIAGRRARLVAARQRLANVAVRGRSSIQSVDQYMALLNSATQEKELAERDLANGSSVFAAEVARTQVGARAIRDALPPRTALLSYYRYDRLVTPSLRQTEPTYIAALLRPESAAPVFFALGSGASIDGLVADWRKTLNRATTGRLTAGEASLRAAGDALRRRVWDPVGVSLDGVDRVFIVPDGSLNLLPFGALPVGASAYLVEKGPTIHYLSAERDLVASGGGPAAVGRGLLALGSPAFQDGSRFAALTSPIPTSMSPSGPRPASGHTALSPVLSNTTSYRGPTSQCVDFQSMTFEPLPSSGKEAVEIANIWTGFGAGRMGTSSPRVLVGQAADERTFKQLGPGHRVLHLATHGFFLGGACVSALEGTRSVGGLAPRTKPGASPRVSVAPATKKTLRPDRRVDAPDKPGENPLLLSGLAMAGANRRASATGDEEDGILTAEEVASLDLSGVEWAVLSACDTGLGEIRAGEGVFGLRRAFQIAGAHTVIMSLWSVEDRAAMEWMRALYESRLAKKLDTADALRQASLSILRQRRARGQSTHPFFWAGFVASGDWR